MSSRAAFSLLVFFFTFVSFSSSSSEMEREIRSTNVVNCYVSESENYVETNRSKEVCFLELVFEYDSSKETYDISFVSGIWDSMLAKNTLASDHEISTDAGIRLIKLRLHGLALHLVGQCFADGCNTATSRLAANLRAEIDRAMKKCQHTIRHLGNVKFGPMDCDDHRPPTSPKDRENCSGTCRIDAAFWCAKVDTTSAYCSKHSDGKTNAYISHDVLDRGKEFHNSHALEFIDPHRQRGKRRFVLCHLNNYCNRDRRPVRNVAQAICHYWLPAETPSTSSTVDTVIGVTTAAIILLVIVTWLLIVRFKIVWIVGHTNTAFVWRNWRNLFAKERKSDLGEIESEAGA